MCRRAPPAPATRPPVVPIPGHDRETASERHRRVRWQDEQGGHRQGVLRGRDRPSRRPVARRARIHRGSRHGSHPRRRRVRPNGPSDRRLPNGRRSRRRSARTRRAPCDEERQRRPHPAADQRRAHRRAARTSREHSRRRARPAGSTAPDGPHRTDDRFPDLNARCARNDRGANDPIDRDPNGRRTPRANVARHRATQERTPVPPRSQQSARRLPRDAPSRRDPSHPTPRGTRRAPGTSPSPVDRPNEGRSTAHAGRNHRDHRGPHAPTVRVPPLRSVDDVPARRRAGRRAACPARPIRFRLVGPPYPDARDERLAPAPPERPTSRPARPTTAGRRRALPAAQPRSHCHPATRRNRPAASPTSSGPGARRPARDELRRNRRGSPHRTNESRQDAPRETEASRALDRLLPAGRNRPGGRCLRCHVGSCRHARRQACARGTRCSSVGLLIAGRPRSMVSFRAPQSHPRPRPARVTTHTGRHRVVESQVPHRAPRAHQAPPDWPSGDAPRQPGTFGRVRQL